MTVTPASLTPHQVRQACRKDSWTFPSTAGICDGYVQANLVILPSKYAQDFRNLCARNPVPCPLLGETKVGDPTIPARLARDCDIRTDAPLYRVYRGGKLVEEKKDIMSEWTDDSVGFLIGCSFSFEAALIGGGLVPRQIEIGRNVPMYATKVPLAPAGREFTRLFKLELAFRKKLTHSLLLGFGGHMVVSMRPYPPDAIEQVRDLTRPFIATHGEPIAWGAEGAAALGINDPTGQNPDFGDPSEIREGEVPVYWG